MACQSASQNVFKCSNTPLFFLEVFRERQKEFTGDRPIDQPCLVDFFAASSTLDTTESSSRVAAARASKRDAYQAKLLIRDERLILPHADRQYAQAKILLLKSIAVRSSIGHIGTFESCHCPFQATTWASSTTVAVFLLFRQETTPCLRRSSITNLLFHGPTTVVFQLSLSLRSLCSTQARCGWFRLAGRDLILDVCDAGCTFSFSAITE